MAFRRSTHDFRAKSVPKMTVTHFTDLTVRALPEGLHFDQHTPGFALRVGKHRRTWLAIAVPNRTKIRLGHYPEMTLQTARKQALLALATPRSPRTAPAFPDAVKAYLAQGTWRPSTRRQIEWTFRHYFPYTKTLDKISHADIAAIIDPIKKPSQRAHALTYIRAFFNWCVPRYLSYSPCTGLKAPRIPSRSRVLTDDELNRVWHAAEQCGAFGIIVKLLILTGQRRGEIAALRASWIKDGTLTLPANATKNGREHTFPTSASCVALLKKTLKKRRAVDEYLFPADPPSTAPFNGWSKSKARLDKLSGVTDWKLHDLRRTFATKLAALGTPIQVTEKLLNHVSGTYGGIVGIYQRHAYWEEQKVAIAAYDAHLQQLFEQST
jgi:integrase